MIGCLSLRRHLADLAARDERLPGVIDDIPDLPVFRKLRTPNGRWKVTTLLDTGFQAEGMPVYSDEEFGVFLENFDLNEMDPLRVSGHGVMYDGNHRSKALLAKGIKLLPDEHVRINLKVDATNVEDYALAINNARRQLSAEQRRDLVIHQVTKRNWTQVRVAKALSITQGRVSQILTEYYSRPPTVPPHEPPEPGGVGRKPGPPGAPDPLTLPRLMWSGPAARLPKALDKLAKDLEACPPSRALVMLHRSDVASIRHRLLECIQVLEARGEVAGD